MIRLSLQFPNQPAREMAWDQPTLTIGRAAYNGIVIPAENVSSQHAQICEINGRWFFRDMGSTNGSLLIRDNQKYLLRDHNNEMAIEVGDVLCLASIQNAIAVKWIDGCEEDAEDEDEDQFERTILAEQRNEDEVEFETQAGEEFDALRATVHLSRELVNLETVNEIARITCATCLQAFPKANRALFLVPQDGKYVIEHAQTSDVDTGDTTSTLMRSRRLLDRCLKERKGFLFLFEANRMQAIATMISAMEQLDEGGTETDRIILCCPLFHLDRNYGFIEVEAPLTPQDRKTLMRRDLSVATLMSHLVAARLHDLENQRARLKLARKATAGFLSATVGHCFKNLLFVPMSMSKMLPMCIKAGKMEEVEWMLARNSVNIRYLDVLSNEFAAASKDPTEGFGECNIEQLLREVADLVGQINPDKVECRLSVPPDLPPVVCHGAGMKRLLMNLTLNSVDALFGDGKREKGLIELKGAVDLARDELCISVRDNGPGIPGPILENLREIFRQVEASADALSELQNIAERVRSTKEQGFKEHYGLGFLFVCQTVNHHHGRLEIESTEGHGAKFLISIPLQPVVAGVTQIEEDKSE
ncbi:MAG TPA: ATP-binding protein [Candidatus Sumerlaeota bacterium]|nr:MAG: Sporulation kinase E [candidate division BRC1 bacterium ADurb.BinA292]HOR28020.1 ATP-binding protein [Candidatus Sumerlaeota bacterium]HPK01532.1 ATP-binding protein [Candidatus Sumerlaeota bacterium]